MLERGNWRVWAWFSMGFLCGVMFLESSSATAQGLRPNDPEKTSAPENVATETVDLLKACKLGELNVVTHSQGQDRVRLTIRNTSSKRLNVVLPAGLVAAATAGQGQGQGRGFQSMGLGMFSNRPGSFGQFRTAEIDEPQHAEVSHNSPPTPLMTVPAGESLDVSVAAVCLNFGLPTPTARDRFNLVDVDHYSSDIRVRKSLRSLGLLGTSQGVAQAVMWRVCNDLTFEAMSLQAGKVVNEHEIALAARFIEALEESTESSLVGTKALTEGRIFVTIQGEGALASEARRLNAQVGNFPLLGLPVRVVEDGELPLARAAVFIRVVLTNGKSGETTGRIIVSYSSAANQWLPLGKSRFQEPGSVDLLDGKAMSLIIDRAIGQAFVTIKPARRAVGSTTLKVDNRLPFTLANVSVRAGASAGSPTVVFHGLGVGPARSSLLAIQAATATIEHVELNGL